MDDWRGKVERQLNDNLRRELTMHTGYLMNAIETAALARKIIHVSDIEVSPYLDPIGRQLYLWHATNKLVHHLAKKLGWTFKRNFSTSYGHMQYCTTVDGITVIASNVKDVPKCEIVPVTEIVKEHTVKRFELKCR